MAGGVELATAYVNLAVSARDIAGDVSRQLRSSGVEASADRVGRSMGSRMSSGFSSTLRVAGALSAALGTAAVGAAGYGLKVAAANEQAQISFTTMLGSAQKSQKFLTQLQAFAAKTPFEFPELQTAASSLISVGISADKVIPIMENLGNATAGMGTGSEGIKRATVALQQMNAAGRITGEDLNQLRDAGIPVYDLLAAATGKSKEAVAELAQKGKLGKTELTQLMKALESGKGLERFAGLMDKQSASLTGLVSTFKDTFGQKLAQAVQPAIPLLKDGLAAATNAVAAGMPYLSAGIASVVVAIRAWQAGGGMERLKSQLTGVRDAIQGWLSGGGLDRIKESFGAIADVVRDFVSNGGLESLQQGAGNLVATLPAFGPLLSAGGKALQFFADNADKLGVVLPYLAAAFAAFKTAQAANNVIGRNSAIGMGLQAGSTLALASSNRTLAASQVQVATSTGAATVATNASGVSKVRDVAATVAQRVATIASAAATKAAAAGQWLLNAALTANPIGLVVAAIAGLIAIVVVAYQKNETFRNVVNAAWQGIKDAVSAVVGWFRETAWPWMRDALQAIGQVATWLWQNVISPYFTAIWGLVKAVFGWIRDTGWPIVRGALQAIGGVVKGLWENIFKPYYGFIWGLVKSVFGWIRDTGWPIVRDAMANIGGRIKSVWEGLIKPAFNSLRAGVGAVVTAFQTARDGVGRAWDGLKDRAKAPIRFVVETVLNNGLISAFNWVSGRIGGPTVPKIPLPRGFAAGGVMPGYTPGRDVHHFFSPTAGGLSLSGGEGIMRPEFTRMVGGKRGIDALNASARRGELPWQSHAGGGVIDFIRKQGAKGFDWLTDKTSAAFKAVRNPLDYLKSKLPKAPPGFLGEFAGATTSKVMNLAVAKIRSLWAEFEPAYDKVGGAGIGSNARGWRELWAIVQRLVPGIQLTSAYRPGAITALGNRSLHGQGRAIDVAPPSLAAFEKIRAAFPNATQLFYSPAGRRNLLRGKPWNLDPVTRAGHYDHIHLAMRDGGVIGKPLLFDQGGVLPPGLSLVRNATGAPEPLQRVDRARGLEMTVNVGSMTADPYETAKAWQELQRRQDALTGASA